MKSFSNYTQDKKRILIETDFSDGWVEKSTGCILVLLVLVLATAVCGCSDKDAGTSAGTQSVKTGMPADGQAAPQTGGAAGGYTFVSLDQDIGFQQNLGNIYAITVLQGDTLDVEVRTSADAQVAYITLDAFKRLTRGGGGLTEGDILGVYPISVAAPFLQQLPVANQDAACCIAVVPADLQKPISGHIKVIRYSRNSKEIAGVSGAEAMEYLRKSANVQQIDQGVDSATASTGTVDNKKADGGQIVTNTQQTGEGDGQKGKTGDPGSGQMSYIAYDNDFYGTGMITSMNPNYHFIPVQMGDTIEVWATSDKPAKFLSGGQGLLNHYIMYNGISTGNSLDNYQYDIIQSESENGGTEYHKVIKIENFGRLYFVFAVQNMEGGNDVTGHMKIKVYSSQTKEQHDQAFNAGADAAIAEAERQGQNLDPYKYGQRIYPD